MLSIVFCSALAGLQLPPSWFMETARGPKGGEGAGAPVDVLRWRGWWWLVLLCSRMPCFYLREIHIHGILFCFKRRARSS